MDYKEKLDAFKSSCRMYKQEKINLDRLMKENEDNPVRNQYYRYVKEDVDFVEKIMDQIEESHGSGARVLIWELFIENKTQAAVCAEYHLTRRQLQYSVDKWMKDVLSEES